MKSITVYLAVNGTLIWNMFLFQLQSWTISIINWILKSSFTTKIWIWQSIWIQVLPYTVEVRKAKGFSSLIASAGWEMTAFLGVVYSLLRRNEQLDLPPCPLIILLSTLPIKKSWFLMVRVQCSVWISNYYIIWDFSGLCTLMKWIGYPLVWPLSPVIWIHDLSSSCWWKKGACLAENGRLSTQSGVGRCLQSWKRL